MRIELWLGGGDDGIVLEENPDVVGSGPHYAIEIVGRPGDDKPIDVIHAERTVDRADLVALGRACLLMAGAAVPPVQGA